MLSLPGCFRAPGSAPLHSTVPASFCHHYFCDTKIPPNAEEWRNRCTVTKAQPNVIHLNWEGVRVRNPLPHTTTHLWWVARVWFVEISVITWMKQHSACDRHFFQCLWNGRFPLTLFPTTCMDPVYQTGCFITFKSKLEGAEAVNTLTCLSHGLHQISWGKVLLRRVGSQASQRSSPRLAYFHILGQMFGFPLSFFQVEWWGAGALTQLPF